MGAGRPRHDRLSSRLALQSCFCKAALSHHIVSAATRQTNVAQTSVMALLLRSSAGS